MLRHLLLRERHGCSFPPVGTSTRMHHFRLRWTSTIRCLPKILPSLSDNPQRTYRLTFRLKLTFLPTGVRLLIEGALLKLAWGEAIRRSSPRFDDQALGREEARRS